MIDPLRKTKTYRRLDKITGGFLSRMDAAASLISLLAKGQIRNMSDLTTVTTQITDRQSQLDAAMAAFAAQEATLEQSLAAVSTHLQQAVNDQAQAVTALKLAAPHVTNEIAAVESNTTRLQSAQKAIDAITAALGGSSTPPATGTSTTDSGATAPPVDTSTGSTDTSGAAPTTLTDTTPADSAPPAEPSMPPAETAPAEPAAPPASEASSSTTADATVPAADSAPAASSEAPAADSAPATDASATPSEPAAA